MRRYSLFLLLGLMILLLCGCGRERPSAEDTKKQELVFACCLDNTGTLETIFREFSEQSEKTRVKLIELPKNSIDAHRILSSALSGQEVEIDAMLAEDVWMGEFVKQGYLKDLSGMVDFSTEEYPAGVAAFSEYGGRLYSYPVILDAGVMYYNTELAEQPATYEKLVGKGGASYTIQETDGEEMLCVALELIRATGSVRDGLELYKTAIAESGVREGDDYLSAFKNGKAAYMRGWASESHDILQGFSAVRGKVRAAAMETAPGETCALARVYGFAVNADSKKNDAAEELLRYLLREDVQKQLIIGTGTLPLKRVYYEDPMIMDSTTYFDDYKNLSDKLTYRPQRDDYTNASREVRAVMTDYMKDRATLEQTEAALRQFLGE